MSVRGFRNYTRLHVNRILVSTRKKRNNFLRDLIFGCFRSARWDGCFIFLFSTMLNRQRKKKLVEIYALLVDFQQNRFSLFLVRCSSIKYKRIYTDATML